MLGNKRFKSNSRKTGNGGRNVQNKQFFKSKTAEEKIGRRKDDEEILSESDEDNKNIEKDDFFEAEDKPETETTDNKRLRLAKKLIQKIGEDIKDDEDRNVDDVLLEDIKKEKNEHFMELSKNLNPVESIFLKGHKNTITALDISSDSKFVISAAKDCRAIKWDLESGKKTLIPQFTKKPLLACMITPGDKYGIFAGADRHIYQIDLHNEKVIESFKAHNDSVTGLVFDSNKDQYYSISNDTTLKVWALGSTHKSIKIETFWGHINKVHDIDMMTNNRVLTCGYDKQINLWKVDSQSFLQFKINESYSLDNIRAFNNDNYLTSTDDGTLLLWRTNKKKPIFKLNNTHGFKKKITLNHPFFFNADALASNSAFDIEISNPITALGCIKNSDLIFTGSTDGNLNCYKYDPNSNDNKIEMINRLNLRDGCTNVIKPNAKNEFLVVANSSDTRLGRWDVIDHAKTGISIVKLFE